MFIQICPALMDWTVFLVLFAVLYGAGERGFSGLQCAWIGGIGQLTYMATSLLAGLVLTRRNARGFLLSSTVGSTLILATLLRHRARPHATASADEHVEEAAPGARAVDPRYVLVGWCLIFTAMVVQRPLQSLWPAMCARAGILAFLPGLVLCLHMLAQGLWGYRVAALTAWRYRRTPLVVLHLGGAVVLGMAWLKPAFGVSTAAIILLGLYTGYAFFAAVYYASNSGRRSFHIGVNECLVGMGSLVGLFAVQWGETLLGADGGMYAVCAVALVASLVIQLAVASR